MSEEIKISKVVYEKGDDRLLERVFKLKKGAHRIMIFMVVGMIVGWFGYTYITDSFIVTKIIFAIPYKISEAIYVSIIGTNALTEMGEFLEFTEFFPQSYLATFLAERITPVLIGMIIFGSLAYFTGDKRVFTLERFGKFLGIQCVILVLFVGGVYGINAKAVSDNGQLKGMNSDSFFLISPEQGERIVNDKGERLYKAFQNGLEKDETIDREIENEIPVGIYFQEGLRAMEALVNTEENYLVTQNDIKYHVSEEFSQYVQEYYETGSVMENQGAEGE